MKITVIGATGMLGSRVVAEAVRRGHEVVAVSRSGKNVGGAVSSIALDLADTKGVVEAIDAGDAAIISVPGPRDGREDEIIELHKALIANPPQHRVLVVGGAGSLLTPDGTRLKDTPDFPDAYKAEADAFTHVLEDYQASDGIDWTLVSPAPVLAPGERTGKFTVGTDAPVGDSISAEDLAVAMLDELEQPQYRKARFTAAN